MKENKPMINLSTEILIRECSLEDRTNQYLFGAISSNVRKQIHDVFGYNKFQYDFSDYLTCYNDGENPIGCIRPSYDDFLTKTSLFLGVKQIDNDDIFLTQKLLERVEDLRTINSEKELKEEFPYLYNDLMQGRKYIHEVEGMNPSNEEEQEAKNALRSYYYHSGLKRSLPNFIHTQCEMYERFILRRKQYKELIETVSYNSYFEKNFDLNKVAMYAAHEYLNICEQSNDIELIEEYFNLLEKYENSEYDKTVSLQVKGKFLDEDSINQRINNVRKRLKRKETVTDWVLVPDGIGVRRIKTADKTLRNISLTDNEIENLRKIGEQKNTFYENTDYMAKVFGLHQYRGYVGYIYPNGEVLLDREYNKDAPSSAKGNAIYHMRAIDFENLSRLDKTTLKNNPKVGRIVHSPKWQEKVQAIIDKEGSELDYEEANELIKHLQQKRQK